MQSTSALNPDFECLVSLNRDYIQSVQTSEVSRFQEILADDFLCSLPDGLLLDREEFLTHTAAPVNISNLETHDVEVRLVITPSPGRRRLLAARMRRHPLRYAANARSGRVEV